MSQKASGEADGSTESLGIEFSFDCPKCGSSFYHYKGMFTHYGMKHDSDEELKEWLISRLQEIKERLGSTPTLEQVNELDSVPGQKAFWNYFGSWSNAVEAAGLEQNVNGEYNPSKDELRDLVEDIAEDLGHTPTQDEWEEHSPFSMNVIHDRFGCWNNVLENVGLDLNRPWKVEQEDLMEEIERLHSELGRPPFLQEAGRISKYGITTFQRHFESWEDALNKCGYEPIRPTGELSGVWKGGWDEYYGENWYRQRKKALERDDNRCVICGDGKEDLGKSPHVHHIVPIREFDDLEKANGLTNLVTLCPDHHVEWEGLYLRPDPR